MFAVLSLVATRVANEGASVSEKLTTESPDKLVPSSSSAFFMKFFASFACGPEGASVRYRLK